MRVVPLRHAASSATSTADANERRDAKYCSALSTASSFRPGAFKLEKKGFPNPTIPTGTGTHGGQAQSRGGALWR